MSSEVKAIALSLQQAIDGFGFRPSDVELINYLKLEVPGCRGNFCIIPTLEDIYKINPWDLPAKFDEQSVIPPNDQDWWFVCIRTQGQRVSRKTPCGCSWKITGTPKDIKAGNDDRKIGSKITLVFQDGVQTNWVIHEYHLLSNDMNRNYVLFHLKRRRDEKADSSITESGHGANHLVDLESFFRQPDPEDSFPEYAIQAKMDSLLQNSENVSVMDFTLDNGPTYEYILPASETSEEDEDIGYMLNGDLIDDDFFPSDQMQTGYGQASDLHSECPVLMENRRTRTIDSLHGVVPLDEKKGTVENKFSGSLVAPEKPMAPPVRTASVKYQGKDEVLWSEKVKQETAAKSIKPECISFNETAARAKTHGPLEQKKGIIQSKAISSHVSSAKPMDLLKNPMTPTMPEPPRIYALRNVKPEFVSLDGAAATAKVLKYQEHCSASKIPGKTNSMEIETAREKSNSVTALTKPYTKSTKYYPNPPVPNLVNVVIGIFLFFAITSQVLNL